MIPKDKVASCGDTSCELLVSPIPRPRVQHLAVKTTPAQRRVVLVDTRKPNSIVVLRKTKALLEARGIEVAEIRDKADPSRPMPAAQLDQLAREGGLFLLGVAD